MHILHWLRSLLQGEGYAGAIEIQPGRKDPVKFTVAWRRGVSIDKRLIILDGTGHKEDCDRLFGRDLKLVDANVSMTGNGNEFIHIRKKMGKTSLGRMSEDTRQNFLRKGLEEAREHLERYDFRLLIATFKNVEEPVKVLASEVFPDRTAKVIHFNASRGLNAYENFDAAILLGTNTKNPQAAWKLAVALGYEDREDVAACIRRQSGSENTQTAHRIRPLKRTFRTPIVRLQINLFCNKISSLSIITYCYYYRYKKSRHFNYLLISFPHVLTQVTW